MKKQLIIRPEAENEMAEAFDWYELRSSGLGFDFLLCVEAVLNSIVRMPNKFPQVHLAVRRALVRRFPYELFFIENEKNIVIIAVFHAKRNPKHWVERI